MISLQASATVAASVLAATCASAQELTDLAPLAAARTYNGIHRPIPIQITPPPPLASREGEERRPADAADAGEVADTAESVADIQPQFEIELVRPDGTVVAEAAAAEGASDLAALFPALWSRPPEEADLLYAQLVIDGERRGAALVLQPMLTPTYPAGAVTGADGRARARASIDRTGRPSFLEPEPGEVVYSGLRIWTDSVVVLETSHGVIELALRPDEAPNTAYHFVELVGGGLYTDVPFHRIVPDVSGHPFVIQTGDPSGTGAGGAGFYMDLEPSGLPHGYGVVSMARGVDPNANSSQFFICLSREATRHLDGAYTSFAQVTAGAEAIALIAATPIDNGGRPSGEPPRLLKARTRPAPPRGSGPRPLPRPEAEATER